MAGTASDVAYLASLNTFIAQVRVALIKRAVEIDAGSDRQTTSMLNGVAGIMSNSEDIAKRMAWLIAAGNPTIAAAAPAEPSEGDTQFAVNTMLPKLVR